MAGIGAKSPLTGAPPFVARANGSCLPSVGAACRARAVAGVSEELHRVGPVRGLRPFPLGNYFGVQPPRGSAPDPAPPCGRTFCELHHAACSGGFERRPSPQTPWAASFHYAACGWQPCGSFLRVGLAAARLKSQKTIKKHKKKLQANCTMSEKSQLKGCIFSLPSVCLQCLLNQK